MEFQEKLIKKYEDRKTISSKHNFKYSIFLFVLIALIFVLENAVLSQEIQNQDRDKYTITLKLRKFIPKAGIESKVLSKLQTIITQEKKIPHIIIQFKKTPSRNEREYLKARGINLLSYIGGNAWYASLSDTSALLFVDLKTVAKYPILGLIRWIGVILAQDKIHPFLKTKGPGSWAINPDGTIKVSIDFFKDISRQKAREILSKYGAEIESERIRRVSFYIIIDPNVLNSFANEDSVKSIDIYPPPKMESNDGSRAWTNTDAVHAAGTEGDSVILGIWDGNEVDDAHHDLGARVTFGEVPRTNTTSEHSTHVAGTLAGDGSVNLNLRGHAPQAIEIVSYDFYDDTPVEMEQAMDDYNIVAANNSWDYVIGWYWDGISASWQFLNNQNLFGDYIGESSDFDDLVRNDKLIIVFAAGNDRNDPDPGNATPAQPADWDQGTGNNGYDTIAPPSTAKNIITVGAINDATGAMCGFSNWGPTDDGRIKPDVVGPGDSIWSCDDDANDNAPGDINDQYVPMWGTSMAAPAVTGISALLLQTYRDEFFGDINSDEVPLPSTIKALLIHSAEELGNPGPDFSFGWGGVNAEAGYNLVRDRLVIESQLSDTGEEDIFLADVPAGETEFNVTICWDDVPRDHLINDLDLSLEAPDGTTHLPWVLDPTPGNWANNAMTGIDRVNNCEQVHVDNPQQGSWKIKVVGFSIEEPAANPLQKYSLVSDFPFYESETVSVVQGIDRTGSMSHRDEASAPSYIESAKTAAQNFIGLMHIGDEVGVVAFDDEGCDNLGSKADPIFNLTEITDETVRNNTISSIDPLWARGCTSIGAGMQLAQNGPDFLDVATADQPHAMVLLTDGFENTPPWVRERPPGYEYQPPTPNNVLLDIPEETDIYTIALGPNADTDLMKDIANTTGGKFYESPTILGLLSIYYQIQGDLELGEMADLETGTKGSGNDIRTVIIDPDASEATFVVGWLQKQGNLKLTLKDPNGKTITPKYPNVEIGNNLTYHFIRIKNPLPGDWEVHILRTDSGTFQVDYTFATFVKGVSKLWSFIPDFTFAGDCLMTKVRIHDSHTLQPITGASVKAIISSPQTSKYTLNYNYVKPKDYKWRPASIMSSKLKNTKLVRVSTSGDKLPMWASNLRYYDQKSIRETGKSIFQYDSREVMLFDDGTHGDEQTGDGIYTNCIDTTQSAGSYNIRFSISGVTPSEANFKRRIVSTATIKPGQVDPVKSLVRVDPAVIDVTEGSEGIITIVSMDRFGNVWGPGFASKISISTTEGVLFGDVKDNGDGFYFQTIRSTGVEGTGRVTVTIDGVEMETKPVVKFTELSYRSVSILAGMTIPTGTFNNKYDSGYSIGLDVDYHFTPLFSAVGILGHNYFDSGSPAVSETYWWNISANLKREFTTSPLRPYVNGGPGIYIPKSGSTRLGFNVGLGLDYALTSDWTVELGGDYHYIFTSGSDTKFFVTHIGLIYRF